MIKPYRSMKLVERWNCYLKWREQATAYGMTPEDFDPGYNYFDFKVYDREMQKENFDFDLITFELV